MKKLYLTKYNLILPGTDGLGSSFIKQLIGVIELPLVLIFQESLRTGQEPVQWKEANVTAIFKKKGLRYEPGNYRPVSLTSQIGRLFERIIRDPSGQIPGR